MYLDTGIPYLITNKYLMIVLEVCRLAEKIKKYMTEKKIPVNKLAEKSGLNVRTLYAIFNDGRKITVEEYAAICKGLNVELDFFFSDYQETA